MKIKQFTLLFFLLLLACPMFAQSKFGYTSFNSVMQLMPEYADYETRLYLLQESYKNEADRMDREFNRQYAEFLHEQTKMSESILKKRQKELQNLMDDGINFKKNAQEQLQNERDKMLFSLRETLLYAIQRVGKRRKLDYIVDTDAHTYLYMGSNGVDVTHDILVELGIEKEQVSGSFDNPLISLGDTLKQVK
ncbi:MAG: OmpH family outer membrane protein [Bacteroidaceae bacterium]|nr:OmpH family outer membrane protein [Bacteroidaceae bacterium]